MDDFKLDAFGLNNPFESSVGSVNVESELLLKLWAAGVLHCAGFVPLGVLLHTNTPFSTEANRSHRLKQLSEKIKKSLTELGKGNSNFTLASRSVAETPVESKDRSERPQIHQTTEGSLKRFTNCTCWSWKVDASDNVQYQVIERQAGVDPV